MSPSGAPAHESAGTASAGSQRVATGFARRPDVHSGYVRKSAPLRRMVPRLPLPEGFGENEPAPVVPVPRLWRLHDPDPVVQRAPGRANMPAPSKSFDGINGEFLDTLPPDPTGEVGSGHYVQATNPDTFAIYSTSGALEFGPAQISTLWNGVGDSCETQGRGDPVVQYDQISDRWLITQFAFGFTQQGQPVGPFFECVAVSTSSDPLGTYFLYSFLISQDTFPDFPKFGVWPDGYYMTAHLFSTTTGQFIGVAILAFDRTAMLSGQPASIQPFQSTSADFYGMLPTDLEGKTLPPNGAPNYLAVFRDNGLGASSDGLEFYQLHIDWSTPANSIATGPTNIATASFDSNLCNYARACIPQGNTTNTLDAISLNLMYRMAYRNMGTHESLVMSHVVDANGNDKAGIRWYEVRSPSTPTIHQQGTYAPDANSRWMSSIGMDKQGNIAIGYSVSGASLPPAIRYAGRLATDPLGTLGQTETSLIDGAGSQTSANVPAEFKGRWGDYTHLSVDPSDDCTFWYTNQYYSSNSSHAWKTRIGSFKFPSCGTVAPTPSPSVTAGPPSPTPSIVSSATPTPAPTSTGPPLDTTPPSITGVADRPDPFSPNGDGRKEKTKIFWTIDEPSNVTLIVYKKNGTSVRFLGSFELDAGDWFFSWNGRNDLGKRVARGTYAYELIATDVAGNASVPAGGNVTVKRRQPPQRG